jgi:hypothetical protein
MQSKQLPHLPRRRQRYMRARNILLAASESSPNPLQEQIANIGKEGE